MPPVNKSNAVMAGQNVPKFIHHISATEAQQLLLTKGFNGSFLVRTSTTDSNVYALSYRELNKVTHIKFETTEEGFTAKNLPDQYATIGALIKTVQERMPGLDYPLWPSDPAPAGLQPRLFFGRLATKHAEKLLSDPDTQPDRNFLIRSSTSFPDQIVLSVRLETGEIVHVLTHRQGDKLIVKALDHIKEFSNVTALIDHYMDANNTMEQGDGTVIKLSKPMICPWNKGEENKEVPSKNAEAPPSSAKRSSPVAKHIADQFEILQSDDCSTKPHSKSEIGRRPENIPKNRYKNILPYDATRVVLVPPPDYINANYLKTDVRLRVYIGCQGPLPHTAVDFWRMIWQQKCRFIVMLTNTVEAGKNKCFQYWPKDEGKDQLYIDPFVIKYQEKVLHVKSDFIISKLRLLNGEEEMPVYHCHYIGWPDKSVPKNIDSLVRFSEEILRMRNLVEDGKLGPIVAHCSAGIGRTGTYVLISMIIDHIQMFGVAPDILDFSKQLRGQRPGMIQTLQQYDLVHKATDIYKSKVENLSAQYGNTGVAAGNVVYGNID